MADGADDTQWKKTNAQGCASQTDSDPQVIDSKQSYQVSSNQQLNKSRIVTKEIKEMALTLDMAAQIMDVILAVKLAR